MAFYYKKINYFLFLTCIFLYLTAPKILSGFYIADIILIILFTKITNYKKYFNNTLIKILATFIILIFLLVILKTFFYGLELSTLNTILSFLRLLIIALIGLDLHTNLEKNEKYLRTQWTKLLFFVLLFYIIIGLGQYFQISSIENFINKYYLQYFSDVKKTNIELFIETNRVVGIFNSFNGFGFFLAFVGFAYFVFNQGTIKIKDILILSLLFTVLLLTNNRTNIFIFLIMIGSYFFTISKNKVILLLSIVILFFIFKYVSNYFFSNENYSRMLEIEDFVLYGRIPQNLLGRYVKYFWMPKYFLNGIYFFIGIPRQLFYSNILYSSPDNEYLALIIYNGVVGLLGYLILLGYLTKDYISKKKYFINSHMFHIYIGGIVILFALFVEAFMQSSFFIPRWREFFIAYLTIIYAKK